MPGTPTPAGSTASVSADTVAVKGQEVINGFDVNKGSGGSALGPSGIAYWCGVLPGSGECPYKNNPPDTLYVADGACNTVVAISHASSLLVKDEITIRFGLHEVHVRIPEDHVRDGGQGRLAARQTGSADACCPTVTSS